MKKIMLLTLFLFICAGCGARVGPADPFGATTRERIRSETQIRAAEEERKAREAEAKAQADAAYYEAEGKADVARAWTAMLPTALLILAGGVCVAVWIIWRSKVEIVALHTGQHQIGQPINMQQLQNAAAQRNMRIEQHGDLLLLIDNTTQQVVKQRQLEG